MTNIPAIPRMSTRFLTTLFLGVLSVAALAAVWYSFGMPGFGGPLPDESAYRNSRYEYAFDYPRTLTLNEYSIRYVTLSQERGDSSEEMLAATVVRPSEGARYASFDAFVRSQLLLLCAADDPTADLECTTVQNVATTSTASGAPVAAYTLDLVSRDRASGAVATQPFGPVYVFDLSAEDINGSYTALMLYAPVIRVVDGSADMDLVGKVANSVTLTGISATTTPE